MKTRDMDFAARKPPIWRQILRAKLHAPCTSVTSSSLPAKIKRHLGKGKLHGKSLENPSIILFCLLSHWSVLDLNQHFSKGVLQSISIE